MKFTWKILLIVLLTVVFTLLLLKSSPAWLIFSIAALLALLGVWQVSQVKAVLNNEVKQTKPPVGRISDNVRQQETQSVKSYWLKRIGLYSLIIIIGVLAESAWWANNTKIKTSNDEGNDITRSLPLSYAFKKPLWELNITPLPKLIKIPAGEFKMGSDENNRENPVHPVTFSQPFLMSQTEVTFEQYDYYIWDLQQQNISNISYLDSEGLDASKEITYPDDENWGRDNRPVINVSWHKAQAYVNWLSKKTKHQCRLPSEAEWEYAARAGTKTVYPWGDKASHEYANYGKDECCEGLAQGKDQWVNTAPVASFEANKFDLHDMHGNVLEWVQDCYHNTYKNSPTDGIVWEDKECGDSRVLRGGSWFNAPFSLRSAFRIYYNPDFQYNYLGFRVVCLPPSAEN